MPVGGSALPSSWRTPRSVVPVRVPDLKSKSAPQERRPVTASQHSEAAEASGWAAGSEHFALQSLVSLPRFL